REAEASLGGFTDRLSLLSEVDEEQGSREARIWLMTLHSAKGLEFPTVIMSGLEEGVFPHQRAFDEEDELDEERRLCYVGMTRARTQLVLTGAARRRVFGEYQAMEPSRFRTKCRRRSSSASSRSFQPITITRIRATTKASSVATSAD